MRHWTATVALAAAAALASGAAGRAAQQFRSTTGVVRVPVLVTGKDGRS
jgi:hypothetical protein